MIATVILALLVTGFSAISRQFGFHSKRAILPATYLCLSLVLSQLILFSKSQTGISVYSDRYLIPVSIVSVFIFAAAFDAMLPAILKFRVPPVTAILTSLGFLAPCCAFAVMHNDYPALYAPLHYSADLAARLPNDAPILVADLPTYMLVEISEPTHRYLYLLDWPFDLRHHATGNLSGQRIMENWRRAGYAANGMPPFCSIQSSNSDFYVLLGSGREDWFDDRLRNNSQFQVRELERFTAWYPLTLWSVHRSARQPPACS
ncbi:MAG: hypothetical protein ACRYFU_08575 [Janthinobacterium lividum]